MSLSFSHGPIEIRKKGTPSPWEKEGFILEDTMDEPPSIEAIANVFQKYNQMIPLEVIRGNRKVIKMLNVCKPEEIINFIVRSFKYGREPTIIIGKY